MNEKNDTSAKTKKEASPSKGNEGPGEVRKSTSVTIHEEDGIRDDSANAQDFKRRQSGKNAVGNSWRKSYINRRKSIDLSEPSQQQGNSGMNRFMAKSQRSMNGQQSAAVQSAKDRRRTYVRANSHRGFTSTDNRPNNDGHVNAPRLPRNGVLRSISTNQSTLSQQHQFSNNNQQQLFQEDDGAVSGGERLGSVKKRNRCSTSTGKGRFCSNSVNSINSESFDYDDDMELEEPFSDSDEESPRQAPSKPSLVVPRGRIRTLSGTVPPVGYSPKWGGPTMCLSCLQFFDLPDQLVQFADHLLGEHQIVVTEMELIVDLKRYIEHWRQRFAKETVNQIFPKIVPDASSPYVGKVDYYYEMSERIPEDYSLRQRLAMRRLEEALACQQREREEVCFSMQCIFCRYVARGNRSKLIHHLYMIHHLNLGSPDNLVFVAEYIDHLKDKLQRNECIYCEKIFSDRTVLMDHMRKRNHREVNPKNNYYDKFYIINYLELGKRWLDVLAEDFEDTMPTFADSDDEEEEESWHEWQEDNADEDQIRALCLFCNFSAEKVESIIEHMKVSHTFDLMNYIKNENMDVYGRMKFLNYVREQASHLPKTEPNGNSLKSIMLPDRAQWDIENSLIPMYGNDNLPWMLESFLETQELKVEKGENNVDIEQVENTWGNINRSFAFLKRQSSIESSSGESVELPAAVKNSIIKALIDASKRNTIDEVIAEDWPNLSGSALSDRELYKSLR